MNDRAQALTARCAALRDAAVRRRAMRDALLANQQDAQGRAAAAQAEVMALDVALGAIHSVREATTARVQGRLADLCTEGLRVVFDDQSVALRIAMVERRGVVEADFELHRGDVVTEPLEGNGGGLVADMAAMLRLVMVTLLRSRGVVPLLVLDEPFAALSAGHRAAMAETLEEVAAAMGIQVITVTHHDAFARGSVYRVEWSDRENVEARIVRAVG